MSTPPRHEDRHSGCGGLWVDGWCMRCQAECQCPSCMRARTCELGISGTVRERDADGRITKFDINEVALLPTRTLRPSDLKPGRWSEHDDD